MLDHQQMNFYEKTFSLMLNWNMNNYISLASLPLRRVYFLDPLWYLLSVSNPSIFYGIVSFKIKDFFDSNSKLIQRLLRFACIIISGALSTTPTTALEIIWDLLTLDLFYRGVVAKISKQLWAT